MPYWYIERSPSKRNHYYCQTHWVLLHRDTQETSLLERKNKGKYPPSNFKRCPRSDFQLDQPWKPQSIFEQLGKSNGDTWSGRLVQSEKRRCIQIWWWAAIAKVLQRLPLFGMGTSFNVVTPRLWLVLILNLKQCFGHLISIQTPSFGRIEEIKGNKFSVCWVNRKFFDCLYRRIQAANFSHPTN